MYSSSTRKWRQEISGFDAPSHAEWQQQSRQDSSRTLKLLFSFTPSSSRLTTDSDSDPPCHQHTPWTLLDQVLLAGRTEVCGSVSHRSERNTHVPTPLSKPGYWTFKRVVNISSLKIETKVQEPIRVDVNFVCVAQEAELKKTTPSFQTCISVGLCYC